MYKSIHSGIKKINLNRDLYSIHKDETRRSDFGMDNTTTLLDGGFGLYSTTNVKGRIGPIKTEYFRISLTVSGSACFKTGLETHRPTRNWILFGYPGQIFSLDEISQNFMAYYMLFNDHFFPQDILQPANRYQAPFFSFTGQQCFELSEENARKAEEIILKMNEEIQKGLSGCAEMIKSFIRQIIIYSRRDYQEPVLSNHSDSEGLHYLYNTYLKFVSQHFLAVRKVSEYARLLHITPDHLNRAIRSCSDKTAHEYIDEMILTEAKMQLLHTQNSVAEVAYQLDFADPSHFSRFFKKLTGITPKEFRLGS